MAKSSIHVSQCRSELYACPTSRCSHPTSSRAHTTAAQLHGIGSTTTTAKSVDGRRYTQASGQCAACGSEREVLEPRRLGAGE